MPAHRIARLLGATAVAAGSLLVTGAPTALAAPCPDVEVVFARGTTEAPGVGGIGQDFVNALRADARGKTVEVYAVNYPASIDFPTAVDGIRDAANRVQSTAARCPDTKIVLGGFSQGAAVMGFVTASAVPDGVVAPDTPQPLPTEVSDHVAAVALFGKPDAQFMKMIDSPAVTVGPLYTAKTIDLCAPGDPICSDGEVGAAHNSYTTIGMVDRAAAYAAGRL